MDSYTLGHVHGEEFTGFDSPASVLHAVSHWATKEEKFVIAVNLTYDDSDESITHGAHVIWEG